MTVEQIPFIFKTAGIALHDEAVERFRLYQQLLLQWNKRVNLISPKDENQIIEKHFLESAGLVSLLSPEENLVMDVGTGAGFPGLPLKIAQPDLKLILVESKRKKGLFLKEVVRHLNLDHVEVLIDRMEEAAKSVGAVPLIVSRAVTDVSTLLQWTSACQKNGGRMLVLKGEDVADELAALESRKLALGIQSVSSDEYQPFGGYRLVRKSCVVEIVRGSSEKS